MLGMKAGIGINKTLRGPSMKMEPDKTTLELIKPEHYLPRGKGYAIKGMCLGTSLFYFTILFDSVKYFTQL